MRRLRDSLTVLLVIAVVCAACGSDDSGKAQSDPAGSPHRGGTFKIVSSGDVDYIDPGQTYYTFGYLLTRVTSRTLVTLPSASGSAGRRIVPDIATDTGTESDGGRTYSFTIKPGVRYQPETASGRPVRSSDFRYAIERGLSASVANPYAGNYFKNAIVGASDFADGKSSHISGIDVSDPARVTFHLTAPTGDFPYRLTLPVSAPVPEEYATPFDATTPSSYGPNFAATGPYQLERSGTEPTGYEAGKRIVLVRNPNWDARTDSIRKAYPDRIEVTEGFADAGLATDKVIRGEFDYNGDFAVPPDKIQRLLQNASTRAQLHLSSTNCIDLVSMNTAVKPFDDAHVRQAVALVLDKSAMLLAAGGPRVGDIATHVLIPGITGFDEAGGRRFDPYPSNGFSGDERAARRKMTEAGYSTGTYDGPPVSMVGSDDPTFMRVADVVQASLAKIGIAVRRESYKTNLMYTKYLQVPDAKVAIGPNINWCWDYPDGLTVIKPLFDGRLVTSTGNTDFSLYRDPGLNELIDKTAPEQGSARAEDWARADKRVMENVPVVPWRWGRQANVVSKRVGGFVFSPLVTNIDLAVAYLR